MLPFLDRHLAPWHLWAGLIAIVALDLSMLLITVPRLAEFSGGGVMLDLRFDGYSVKEASAYLAALGEEGRRYYAQAHVTVDTLFAIIEAATLMALIVWFTRPDARYAVPLPSVARWAALLPPVGAAFFDVRENILVREMLQAPFPPDPELVAAASFSTQAKWVLAALSILLVLALAIGSMIRARKNART